MGLSMEEGLMKKKYDPEVLALLRAARIVRKVCQYMGKDSYRAKVLIAALKPFENINVAEDIR